MTLYLDSPQPNWEMLARVRDRIAEVGDEHCDMGLWSNGIVRAEGEPDCGTAACIAGWAIALHAGRFEDCLANDAVGHPADRAAEILGLAPDTDGQITKVPLFGIASWPDRYADLLEDEGDAKGMLAILDDILDRKIDPNTLEPI